MINAASTRVCSPAHDTASMKTTWPLAHSVRTVNGMLGLSVGLCSHTTCAETEDWALRMLSEGIPGVVKWVQAFLRPQASACLFPLCSRTPAGAGAHASARAGARGHSLPDRWLRRAPASSPALPSHAALPPCAHAPGHRALRSRRPLPQSTLERGIPPGLPASRR